MKRLFKKIYFNVYVKIFPDYPTELEKALEGCRSILDLGCGINSPIQNFSNKFYSVGVDIFQNSIDVSNAKKIHNKYYIMDVLDIKKKFKLNSFDCVLASDLIEHLTKEEGHKLLQMMSKIAQKKIIIFTPNGPLPQNKKYDNPWQQHKSSWTSEEMKNLGFAVVGINGIKGLRGARADIRFKPRYFWRVISDISQFFVKNRPEKAFQILCIKEI